MPVPHPDPQTLPAFTHLVAVCAHPDDESFGLGAVISTFTERQTLVDLVCLTRGEASTLGRVEVADFPDGNLVTVPATQLALFIAPLAIGADALLVFDENGITGHPDHQAATAAALVVAQRLDVTVLAWTIPATVARIVNLEFGATFIGRPDDRIDVSIAVDRTRQRRAIACHTSQLRDNPVPHRRLALTGDTEYLLYLRRADHPPASHAEHPGVRPRAS